jgi:hypothetical protein
LTKRVLAFLDKDQVLENLLLAMVTILICVLDKADRPILVDIIEVDGFCTCFTFDTSSVIDRLLLSYRNFTSALTVHFAFLVCWVVSRHSGCELGGINSLMAKWA